MDMLSISMPMADMNDWVQVPSKQKKANPMSYEDRDKDIVFTIDMPGVAKKDIDISIEDHAIKVTAQNGGSRNYNYTRRFKPTVDESSAVATFKNGVLDITVMKVEEKKGTKVNIK
jgi:HSP20 family protein